MGYHSFQFAGQLVVVAVLCMINDGATDSSDAGLRFLLLNEHNQDLVDHLGTRYEVVHPFQIRKDWSRGLSTRLSTVNGTTTHIQETTLRIETYEYKLQLDLELNTKLFAPTLVQLLYLKDSSPVAVHKLPENCYYHAKVRNYPQAKAAFQTCNGIRGVIYLGDRIFFIHPLQGNHSDKRPHLLYHLFPGDKFICGNAGVSNQDPMEEGTLGKRKDELVRNKYIEIALVLDQSLFQKFKSPPSDVLAAAVEIINYVDLLYRPLNTSVSLVYLELWTENQIGIETNITATLNLFKDYAIRRISRISVDATHLMTGAQFENGAKGQAILDSICTNNAVGITQVENIFQPHLSAFILAHTIGHNLGMDHDLSGCDCVEANGCIMGNHMPILSSTVFSSCSVLDYYKTLTKGYGACLYNMPSMRMSICGNSILEDPEQCDCGTVEECIKSNPCCDPMTCRLIKHAQCSSGPCCRKCKLLSPDQLCRVSKGECDIPEFCDGQNGECPEDLFKRNGAFCSDGDGYCFQGVCPVLKHQCQEIWGKEADSADSVCYERLNVQGTPNGNCGSDGHGTITKCSNENSYCGFLQCSGGEKTPVSADKPPIHFVVHKINTQGTVHDCKARTLSTAALKEGLVKEGTKCGYQKLCINQTCTSIKSFVSGKCPLEQLQRTCSEHGICTNINTCFCNEGWKGVDCSIVDEETHWRSGKEDSEYYDSIGGSNFENTYYGENEMKLNPNLAITVIAASIVIGVGLVVIVVLLLFYRYT